jgi:hypothetical protein
MGFSKQSISKGATFFENLLSLRQLAGPYWGLYVERLQTINTRNNTVENSPDSQETGELCLGCIDSSRFTGDVSYYTVQSQNHWSISMLSITNKGKTLDGSTSLSVILDPGGFCSKTSSSEVHVRQIWFSNLRYWST